MWRNYLTVGLRALVKNRTYAFSTIRVRFLSGRSLGDRFANDLIVRPPPGAEADGPAARGLNIGVTRKAAQLFGSRQAAAAVGQQVRVVEDPRIRMARDEIEPLERDRARGTIFAAFSILAAIIAWPVAWWAMRDWLNTFDARIELGPGPFVVAGLLALGIAVATVAGHAFKVARLNPIHALRYE